MRSMSLTPSHFRLVPITRIKHVDQISEERDFIFAQNDIFSCISR